LRSGSAIPDAAGTPPTRRRHRAPRSEHDFQPDVLLVSAGQAANVIYRNQEEGTEHNFAIYGRKGGELIARSDNIVGPHAVSELVLPPLAPGTYFVQCDIHPFMTAALTASIPGSS
jgi:plastocyanin